MSIHHLVFPHARILHMIRLRVTEGQAFNDYLMFRITMRQQMLSPVMLTLTKYANIDTEISK